jgi:DNA polymerase
VNSNAVLAQIASDVSVCTRCELHNSRKNAVPGEGPADAKILFIGEGPGFHENEQGRPFVGAAGKLLEELLARIGMKREQVYITNVVKCRPPGNRDPRPEEIDACSEYLDAQVQAISPMVIVTLGRYSMSRYLPQARISEVHGQAFRVKGRLIVPMYHPAAALHQASLRPVLEKDFSLLPAYISEAQVVPEPDPAPAPNSEEPKQLSLF